MDSYNFIVTPPPHPTDSVNISSQFAYSAVDNVLI